jgi:hypothetical protein
MATQQSRPVRPRTLSPDFKAGCYRRSGRERRGQVR